MLTHFNGRMHENGKNHENRTTLENHLANVNVLYSNAYLVIYSGVGGHALTDESFYLYCLQHQGDHILYK